MDILKLLFDNFWGVIIFLAIFGGSIGAGLRWFIRHSYEHRERMQEKKNEELRLNIQLEQAKHERLSAQRIATSSDPLPKDASWNDHIQATYETGYQQQIQQQSTSL
ncbi:MAG: hypothetical protein ABI234_05045 [Ktedonobacteraceae bacterium]